MPRKAREKSGSGIYHVILRGANRQEIFHEDEDCQVFLATLARYKIKSALNIYAWCLMSNHVHLLVREGNEELSLTMKRIGVSFVHYYNTKYRTNGHLFQDRFKSENVESDRYLVTVVRYIHQNPLKAGAVSRVEDWKWSSCQAYYGKNKGRLLDRAYVLERFSDSPFVARERFRQFNEMSNQDQCLDETNKTRIMLTDDEARAEIRKVLGLLEIPHIKTLPKEKRNQLLKEIKKIKGLSQRQAARILGNSPNLVFKA
jgi:putative transposase